MSNIITSFGFGEAKSLLDLTYPSYKSYANKYNYKLYCPDKNFFSKKIKEKPYSWWKIELIEILLKEYENVIWIDADILIVDESKNILNDLYTKKDTHMGLVVHDTKLGKIPNCGLWALNQRSLNWISDIYKFDNRSSLSNYWWEQAALMSMMKFNFKKNPIKIPDSFNFSWTSLPYYWNPHVYDSRGIYNGCLFFHSTMFKNKLNAITHVKTKGFNNLETLEIINN